MMAALADADRTSIKMTAEMLQCRRVIGVVLVAPQLAMGAVGRLQRLPRFVSKDSLEVQEAKILPVSWAADHRYLDGATLARFHMTVQHLVEDPWQMMIHMK